LLDDTRMLALRASMAPVDFQLSTSCLLFSAFCFLFLIFSER